MGDLTTEQAVMDALDHMRSWTDTVTGALLGLTFAIALLAGIVWTQGRTSKLAGAVAKAAGDA